MKCGYKSLSQDSLQEDLCEYCEANKATLKLDSLGSGVVFFPAPSSHRHYKVPGLAVEESLKHILLNLDGYGELSAAVFATILQEASIQTLRVGCWSVLTGLVRQNSMTGPCLLLLLGCHHS